MSLDRIFTELVRRFAGLVRERARRAAFFSKEDADDLAQEVWIKLWQALERDPDRDFTGAFVLRIASNAAIDRLRFQGAKARSDGLPFDEAAEIESASPSPEQKAEQEESARLLVRRLQQLPHSRQRVVMLRLLGHSVDEMAEILGITYPAAAKLVQRGLGQARELLTAARQ